MINIVIPMAGAGSRFAEQGYEKPKPFIDVNGIPMIERVMANVAYPNARYILIAQKSHLLKEAETVERITSQYNAHFVGIDKLTEGTACTVLYAKKLIDEDTPLLIANSDQLVDVDLNKYIDDCLNRKLDGSILVFKDEERNPKWSFAKVNDKQLVTEVKEKVAISDLATVGIYLFGSGKQFVSAAIQMIIENDRVNNEFYTCPVYNYLIREDKQIGVFEIEQKQMHGIGTPEDLNKYLKLFK
jgi:NDP-sugar pyrophosphorylase family protein